MSSPAYPRTYFFRRLRFSFFMRLRCHFQRIWPFFFQRRELRFMYVCEQPGFYKACCCGLQSCVGRAEGDSFVCSVRSIRHSCSHGEDPGYRIVERLLYLLL